MMISSWHYVLAEIRSLRVLLPSAMCALLLCVLAPAAHAQLVFTSPATDVRVKACDDYATNVLHNPWDMADTTDINNFFPVVELGNFGSANVQNGQFSGTANVNGAGFYLISPTACGAFPVGGRFGE